MDNLAIFVAKDLYLGVIGLAILFLAAYYWRRWLEIGIALVSIGVVAYLLSKIGAGLIASPRPFKVTGQAPLIASAIDNGFPSDHTLLVATLAAVVCVFNWRVGLGFWLLAALIGLARIYVGVHHYIDVIGSLLIVGLALAIYWVGRRLWQQYLQRRFGNSAVHANK